METKSQKARLRKRRLLYAADRLALWVVLVNRKKLGRLPLPPETSLWLNRQSTSDTDGCNPLLTEKSVI